MIFVGTSVPRAKFHVILHNSSENNAVFCVISCIFMYLRSFVAKIAKVAKYSFFGVICLPKRCGCVFFFTNIKAVCRWLDFLSLNPALCCRNCCVNQYFAPLFFVVFVLMAQFVLVRNNIKRKIRKERIIRLSTPMNNSNNTGKRRGCRSYETS